jgi:bacteriocin-like protein
MSEDTKKKDPAEPIELSDKDLEQVAGGAAAANNTLTRNKALDKLSPTGI